MPPLLRRFNQLSDEQFQQLLSDMLPHAQRLKLFGVKQEKFAGVLLECVASEYNNQSQNTEEAAETTASAPQNRQRMEFAAGLQEMGERTALEAVEPELKELGKALGEVGKALQHEHIIDLAPDILQRNRDTMLQRERSQREAVEYLEQRAAEERELRKPDLRAECTLLASLILGVMPVNAPHRSKEREVQQEISAIIDVMRSTGVAPGGPQLDARNSPASALPAVEKGRVRDGG
jgi:hypothetical protein